MNLHENRRLFKDAIAATSQIKKIAEIYVEKDYWVTLALHSIFTSDTGEYCIFKGGTALSKCYHLIERFSEDIDIVLMKQKNESSNKLKNKLKVVTNIVGEILPEVEVKGITNKKGMIRKTVHNYPKIFKGTLGEFRDGIIVEVTWFGSFEPYQIGTVSSFIYEMLLETNQIKLAQQYGLSPFKAHVLSPQRTFCEKIMSLVRFSYSPNPIEDLKNKIRHIYDLNRMLADKEINVFFNSALFEKLLINVAKDDFLSFRGNNKWLKNHPVESIIFADINYIWEKLRHTYFSSFSKFVFGNLPSESSMIETLIVLKKRLEKIKWEIFK